MHNNSSAQLGRDNWLCVSVSRAGAVGVGGQRRWGMLAITDIMKQDPFKFSVNPVTQTYTFKEADWEVHRVKVDISMKCDILEISKHFIKFDVVCLSSLLERGQT